CGRIHDERVVLDVEQPGRSSTTAIPPAASVEMPDPSPIAHAAKGSIEGTPVCIRPIDGDLRNQSGNPEGASCRIVEPGQGPTGVGAVSAEDLTACRPNKETVRSCKRERKGSSRRCIPRKLQFPAPGSCEIVRDVDERARPQRYKVSIRRMVRVIRYADN